MTPDPLASEKSRRTEARKTKAWVGQQPLLLDLRPSAFDPSMVFHSPECFRDKRMGLECATSPDHFGPQPLIPRAWRTKAGHRQPAQRAPNRTVSPTGLSRTSTYN